MLAEHAALTASGPLAHTRGFRCSLVSNSQTRIAACLTRSTITQIVNTDSAGAPSTSESNDRYHIPGAMCTGFAAVVGSGSQVLCCIYSCRLDPTAAPFLLGLIWACGLASLHQKASARPSHSLVMREGGGERTLGMLVMMRGRCGAEGRAGGSKTAGL
eukprot:1979931-Rhodomonas_salina.1